MREEGKSKREVGASIGEEAKEFFGCRGERALSVRIRMTEEKKRWKKKRWVKLGGRIGWWGSKCGQKKMRLIKDNKVRDVNPASIFF